ncbi:hypothetical protein PTSG_05585 [Salpingoeca rosetta]|uniref:Nuclear control of ATPase protein 2 n=1 Tax=Salpingoeca rosetta (strain ATCC 50818 / BSB-021) TaxID=946362 RepID=F2UBM4_SALR5|nr:uncharacterized protein PTSG_05585 [Salpingoeca rosetta]EGD73890.1 hypothetical protein PTSG_05585 [Salpingoeca rosetta]|eukprot:XP_004993453.1 hypothetical protein PTSG_05585 [Salpingoeca rosetta]
MMTEMATSEQLQQNNTSDGGDGGGITANHHHHHHHSLFELESHLLLFSTLRIKATGVDKVCAQISSSKHRYHAWRSISSWSVTRQAITFGPVWLASSLLDGKGFETAKETTLKLPSSVQAYTKEQRYLSQQALDAGYDALTATLHDYHTSDNAGDGDSTTQASANAEQLMQRVQAPPPPLFLYWPHLLAGVCCAGAFLRVWKGLDMQRTISNFVHGVYETTDRYLRQRVWKPLVQMYNTIRYDRHDLALQRRSSLDSDLTSLKRMVQTFAQDALGYTDPDLIELADAVDNGDITPVLLSYENDMRRPIHSALFGNMIRATLIQVQKSKVDLQLAVSAVDKLLKSNELNFQMMAIIPALALAWMLMRQTVAMVKRLVFNVSVTKSGHARHLVGDLRRLIASTAAQSTPTAEGQIAFLCIAIASQVTALTLMGWERKEMILKDLETIIFAGIDHVQTQQAKDDATRQLLLLQTRLALVDGMLVHLK